MAHDTSQTRNRTILTVAIVTVLFLVSVKFVLDTYFIQITEATVKEKLASPEALIKQREAEKKALAGGPVNIDTAMGELARGRDVPHAVGADITPRPSDDINAMTGWSKMPKTFAAAPITEVQLLKPAAPTDPAASTLDGGATDAAVNSDAAHH